MQSKLYPIVEIAELDDDMLYADTATAEEEADEVREFIEGLNSLPGKPAYLESLDYLLRGAEEDEITAGPSVEIYDGEYGRDGSPPRDGRSPRAATDMEEKLLQFCCSSKTSTQTHRHTTHTHAHTHTDTDKHTHTDTHRHTRTHRHTHTRRAEEDEIAEEELPSYTDATRDATQRRGGFANLPIEGLEAGLARVGTALLKAGEVTNSAYSHLCALRRSGSASFTGLQLGARLGAVADDMATATQRLRALAASERAPSQPTIKYELWGLPPYYNDWESKTSEAIVRAVAGAAVMVVV
ncbi:hypothetical protein T492DRAFT_839704 [Pavlovales sp. CCMP2436]|nr:hypothetical protein T492DRAFT_839704 [Pavlovales sp. CCMP2436]